MFTKLTRYLCMQSAYAVTHITDSKFSGCYTLEWIHLHYSGSRW